MTMLEDLREVVRLFNKLPKDGKVTPTMYADAALAEISAVNFFRTHAEQIERDARDAQGEREESWEIWQDGAPVAGSDSLADAQHYMLMYGQDGPVKLVRVITYRQDAAMSKKGE